MIFILDYQQNTVGVANNGSPYSLPYFDDEHNETLDGVNTYSFSVPCDHEDSSLFVVEGHVIITNLDGEQLLFTIKEVSEGSSDGKRTKDIYCEETAISELLTDVQRPEKLVGVSLETAVNAVLTNSAEWKVSDIPYTDSMDVEFTDYITVLEALRQLMTTFNMEMYFTVKLQGTKIVEKQINIVEQRGDVTDVRFDYSHDLKSVTRSENSENVVTALIGVGKGNNTSVRLDLTKQGAWEEGDFYHEAGADWIGSYSALQQWGNNGRHRFGVFVSESADTDKELKRQTLRELKNRIQPSVTYSSSVTNLERLTGYEAKQLRIGDTISINDFSFANPIVISGRVKGLKRSYTRNDSDTVDLGSYKARTLSPNSQIKDLQNLISKNQDKWNTTYVGARNLLEGSSTDEYRKAIDQTVGNYKAFIQFDITHVDQKLSVGDTVTISFDVQMEKGTHLEVYDKNNYIGKYFGTKVFDNIGTDKRRLSWTFTVQDKAKEGKVVHTLDFYCADVYDDRFTIDQIKIEKGTVATDYTKAPEDIDTNLNDLGQQVTDIDGRTTPDVIVDTIVYNEAFTSIMNGKANVEDISDMATGEQITQAMAETVQYVDGRLDGEGGIVAGINEVRSALEKTASEINARFGSSGGVNLIRNSIGFAELDFWELKGGTVRSVQNPDLEQLGFGSGFHSDLGVGGYIEQKVNVNPTDANGNPQKHSLSFWLKKTVDNLTSGWAGVDVYDATGQKLAFVGKAAGAGTTNGWELGLFTFETPYNEVTIRVTFGANSEATVSGLMLNVGDIALQWQHANGEMYNTNIKFNLNGIKVINLETNSQTVISPTEFSGYAEVVNEDTGERNLDRIFTLNGDTTEVSKLDVDQEMKMQSIAMRQITNANNSGWGWIPQE
ncbi:phage tail spike protein [Bacillus sp. Bos-x628]|uniref:phage tail spike protein n=1 Tax=Bacillus maqinnsis TaxID=3229854 RepID=UPI00338F3844